MDIITKLMRTAFCSVAMLLLSAMLFPAAAQDQSVVNPTASAVHEQQLLEQFHKVQGSITIPDKKEAVLIQPAGREWRRFHEVALPRIGAVAIIGILVLLIGFYLWRGPVRLESGWSGRKILRFTDLERGAHWMTATSFIVLAITGVNVTFGKRLLLPLLGPEMFTTWSQWAKYAHNFVAFPFVIGLVTIFLIWLPANIPNHVDLEWLKRGGGIIGHDHPPAYRFNAGQKAIYWLVVAAGTTSAITGFLLIFPFYGTEIGTMQDAQIIHGIVGLLFVALILAHIYIGTIGMAGAFEAMGNGTVDLNWAAEHHRLWLEEEQARVGPFDRLPQPAGVPAIPAE
jgi:formate dehydrogenase subunit gamma